MPTIHSIHLMAENYTVLDGESLARIGKCVDRGHPAFPPNQTFPLLRFAAVYLRLRGHRSKKPMCKFLDVLETEFELALRMQNAHVVNSFAVSLCVSFLLPRWRFDWKREERPQLR
ncbi:hypothetical protein I7I50_03791 [Histoplasma capsulatum G186AR]|uniref:Uncharacterized protein n=1 Tax=Ajellomyces capsulatus TaxID=5037 RepID=A0A8H8CXJ0_AJECA|nr:hypothetical protein I7I52_04698 [Histoplasma capsulatum]QSS74855.1 hypothetical protein I7I50_03791 [Histoplasma capsulatum G186AR]